MANLLGQNIGTNYKGILNLNTLNGNLSGTLQAVTDGDGNASPLRLSTSQVSNVFAGSHTILWRANATLTDYSGWHQADGTFVILKKDNSPLWFNIDSAVNFSSGFGSTGRSSINAAGNWTIGGSFTNLARLHVRGDGTNPIARFENSAGTLAISVSDAGQLSWAGGDYFELTTSGRNLYSANILSFLGTWANAGAYVWGFLPTNSVSATSGTHGFLNIGSSSFAAAAGSANFRPLNIAYTINNSGAQTGNATGIFLNATETALNGMTHNLMDLQMGGTSRFSVSRLGLMTAEDVVSGSNIRTSSSGSYQWTGRGRMNSPSDGIITLFNNGSTDFSRLQFGGTTSSFPAIKRNAAALDVRLADDSDFANLGAKEISASVGFFAPNSTEVRGNYIRGRSSTYMNFSSGTPGVVIDSSGASSASASAILQADSTTKGFLPPRMTTAQRDLIATPAAGLVIYNTSTNVLNFYNGTAWAAV